MLYKYILQEVDNKGSYTISDGLINLKEIPTNQLVEKLLLKELEEIIRVEEMCLHNEIEIKDITLDYVDLSEAHRLENGLTFDSPEYYVFTTTLVQNKCRECINQFGLRSWASASGEEKFVVSIEFFSYSILEGGSLMPEEFLTHKFTPIREYAKKIIKKN